MIMKQKNVVIIGAGPAGLTAALELLRRSSHKPVVLEMLDDVGGISRTIEHKGNRMDIGGHRFFSKSDWVMNWWREIMPPAETTASEPYRVPAEARVMLTRPRLSRIYFLRKFFDYPISLNLQTMRNLGPIRLLRIGISYVKACLFPIKPEKNLEDFFINRFGRELYLTFFKDYTEKVWGVECQKISPEWGAQRIKGLSITKALIHAAKKIFSTNHGDVAQKGTETSLIEKFLYPKYGPGQMWQTVSSMVKERGGEVRHGYQVTEIRWEKGSIIGVSARNLKTGESEYFPCDYLISTTSVKELISGFNPPVPSTVKEVAMGLAYRDFLTLGLLVKKLQKSSYTIAGSNTNLVPDTWIYIQEPDVKIGRLQVFNNWSPAMVANPETVWLGLEYFCEENDRIWDLPDDEMARFAIAELEKIDLIDSRDVLDYKVVRVPKAYPAYFGTYDRFDEIRKFTDGIGNLFLVGRNGMHRYNNQDHSMTTAKLAVDNILSGETSKENIWTVNVEKEYHEEKAS
jgi:protoporphyrinogen oxidase